MPVWISSAMSRQLCRVVRARSSRKNSTRAGSTPASPCTGSSITAAVRSVMSASTEARSFNVALGKPSTWGANMVSQPGLPLADMVARVRP
jgi:hypothetical protein